MFGHEGARTARLMIYLLLALALMAMDQRGHYVPRLRSALGTALEPVFHVVEWPANALRAVRTYTTSYRTMLEENRSLNEEILVRDGAAQQLETLRQENRRLRALLEATAGREYEFRFAEMVQVNLDPFSHQVIIDRGGRDGVFVGQAVIDGAGIMGQVEEVHLHMSGVRLISDPDHALPVQLTRTGLRTVAFGTGETSRLALPNVPLQADVRSGDLLVTSGLGDRFPAGFPVAEVESVRRDPGGMFAEVEARPLAALDRGREVLLVLPAGPADRAEETPDATAEPEGQP
ncbi:MAG: rod shape-determining protein MreC [Xanthomonadales bacterium]|nr:rod shape-determining protein MreC [Xanthomonadales bacterium]NIX13235.1 rod shape-determining protein MreC [Xanthomonadales bacterium]